MFLWLRFGLIYPTFQAALSLLYAQTSVIVWTHLIQRRYIINQIQSNVFLKPFLHQLMSQSAV
jgi:hypothetical protein